jgi:hypothetical protein
MEDDLNLLENGRRTQIFGIRNNLKMFSIGRIPQYKVNWKTRSIPFTVEYGLRFVLSKPSISTWVQLV